MRRSLAFLVPVCILLTQPANPSQRPGELDPATKRQRIEAVSQRQREGRDLPIADAGAAGAPRTVTEQQRARYFNTQRPRKLVDEVSGGEPVTDQMLHTERYGPPLPALPFAHSDVVIRGTVTSAQAQLSEDETNLYSTLQVRTEEVFKQPPGAQIQLGATVTAIRRGGALRVRTTVARLRDAEETLPVTGGDYILFLRRYSTSDSAMLIVTGYRLDGATVTALDTRGRSLEWEGASAIDLVTALTEQAQ
jgi:hypothetical protein